MARFDLDNYVTVADRITQFRSEYPTGVIQSHIISFDNSEIVFESRVYRSREDFLAGVFENGFAHEVSGSSPVNKTSYVENAETSAVGRALANLGMSVRADAPRPSREEMVKVDRTLTGHESDLEFISDFVSEGEDVDVEINGEETSLIEFIKKNSEKIKKSPKDAAKAVKLIQSTQEPPVVEDEEEEDDDA